MEMASRDSSSEEKTLSGSGLNTAELSKNVDIDAKSTIRREDTPDSNVWTSNKVPRLVAPRATSTRIMQQCVKFVFQLEHVQKHL
nr:WRKY transcription factor 6-like [Tanacetum cinerariifolium]